MSWRRRGSIARDRGAAAVEFALVLPVLLLIVFGIIDFGRALNTQITLTQAAREGARLDALGYSASQVCNRAVTAATSLSLTCANVTVQYSLNGVSSAGTCPAGAAVGGGDGTVQISSPFSFITPIGAIAGFFGGSGFVSSFTLTAQGVMPCET